MVEKKKSQSRFDTLGDRMKNIEMIEAGRKLIPGIPVIARLDGRSFHTFTKGMARPYFEPMSRAMIETAKFLVEETHAQVAYTQSDEITLVFWNDSKNQELLFDGRVQKLCSVLAGLATAKFNQEVMARMPEKAKLFPVFDCRVFSCPVEEVGGQLNFRYLDAVKNSITMAASAYYSHKELHGKHSDDKHEMLRAKGINWNDYPRFFKEGSFLKRVTVEKELSSEELARIPEKHRPTGKVLRNEIQEMDWPHFNKIQNQFEVLTTNAVPILRTE